MKIPLWILEVAESRRGGLAGEEEGAERGGLGLAGGVCRNMYIAHSSWYIVNLGMGFVDFSCGCGDGDQDFYFTEAANERGLWRW